MYFYFYKEKCIGRDLIFQFLQQKSIYEKNFICDNKFYYAIEIKLND